MAEQSAPLRCLVLATVMLAGIIAVVGSGGGGGGGSGGAVGAARFTGLDTADIDGDGLIDFAVARESNDSPAFFIDVYLQDVRAPGSFLAPRGYLLDSFALLLQLADLNGDLRPDIVASGGLEADIFTVLYQDQMRPGEFSPAREFPTLSAPVAIATGDMDLDGRQDVLMGGRAQVGWHAQDGNGDFGPAQVIGNANYSIAVADINADLRPDVVSNKNAQDGSGTLFYFLQEPAVPGTFAPAQAVALGDLLFTIAAEDINGDELVDLAAVGYYFNEDKTRGRLALKYQVSADPVVYGERIRYETSTGGFASEFDFGDLDGDGRTDIAIGNRTADDNPNNVQIWLQQAANGAFLPDRFYNLPRDQAVTTPEIFAVKIADLNHDLLPDILVSTGEVFALFQIPGSPGQFDAPVRLAGQR